MLACFVLSILLVAWLASLTPEAEAVPAEADGRRRRRRGRAPNPSPMPSSCRRRTTAPDPAVARRATAEPRRDPDGITLGVRPT